MFIVPHTSPHATYVSHCYKLKESTSPLTAKSHVTLTWLLAECVYVFQENVTKSMCLYGMTATGKITVLTFGDE